MRNEVITAQERLHTQPGSAQGGSHFQPELGQMLWGQPVQQYEVPPIFDAALEGIRAELGRVMWNLRQRSGGDPFGNEGASFRCERFIAVGYSWNDERAQPWNFKHLPTGIEVSWYKYAGRGMSANRALTPQDASDVLIDCLAACQAVEGGAPWDEPGLYPEGSPDDAEATTPASESAVGMERDSAECTQNTPSVGTEGESTADNQTERE